MSRKAVFGVLVLLVGLSAPSPAEAQSSFKISREFLNAQLVNNSKLEGACGALEITGRTGWLFIELRLSSYIQGRVHASFAGKDLLDFVYVDCGPFYLPDLFLGWPDTPSEPKNPVEGQPVKYSFKMKLGRYTKPFLMKICRGAVGYWQGQRFTQMAQAMDLRAAWVEGDQEPENPLRSTQTSDDPGHSLSGDDWSYGPTTRVSIVQQGASITINSIVTDHGTAGPHYQITGTVQGDKITGTWRWIGTTNTRPGDRRFLEARCMSGSITAEIASDRRSLRIISVEDPCGHGWNGIVIRR